MRTNIYVYAGWMPKDVLVGTYSVERENNVVMFRYDDDWLVNEHAQIDPQLPLYQGWQYCQTNTDRNTFGFISDASPDRWGKNLIIREEAREAKQDNRRRKSLSTEDYLLRVSDKGRSGGLRFRTDKDGPFLSTGNNIPKMTALRKLENAALQYNDPKGFYEDEWIKDIFEPGSSLGGARPKANVIDTNGDMWIAKFPSTRDHIVNVAAWEKVSSNLAKKCGIHVPDTRLLHGNSEYGDIFLSKRFDRTFGQRIHMMSSMTALELTDAMANESGKGFLDIAEFISKYGANPNHDLKELFKRISFSVCISNTDCHFRNHAFMLSKNAWELSPAYDMNPSVEKGQMAIPITDIEKDIDLDLVRETASFYRLTDSEAASIIHDIQDVVDIGWRKEANRYGISKEEQDYMHSAFSASEHKLEKVVSVTKSHSKSEHSR